MAVSGSGTEVLDILFEDSLLEEIAQVESHRKETESNELPWPSFEETQHTLVSLNSFLSNRLNITSSLKFILKR